MKKVSNEILTNFLAKLKLKQDVVGDVLEAEKLRFLHKIIHDYNDHRSFMFWKKIVDKVPLAILKEVKNNIELISKDGYHINNKAGFFVSTLKKLGYIGRLKV